MKKTLRWYRLAYSTFEVFTLGDEDLGECPGSYAVGEQDGRRVVSVAFEAPGAMLGITHNPHYEPYHARDMIEELARTNGYRVSIGAPIDLTSGLTVTDEALSDARARRIAAMLAKMSAEQWKTMLGALDPADVFRFVEFIRDFTVNAKLMLIRQHYAVNATTRACLGDWTSNEAGDLIGAPWAWIGDRIMHQTPPTENGKRVRQTPAQARAWVLEQLEQDGYKVVE